jgi:hypothetical protein
VAAPTCSSSRDSSPVSAISVQTGATRPRDGAGIPRLWVNPVAAPPLSSRRCYWQASPRQPVVLPAEASANTFRPVVTKIVVYPESRHTSPLICEPGDEGWRPAWPVAVAAPCDQPFGSHGAVRSGPS